MYRYPNLKKCCLHSSVDIRLQIKHHKRTKFEPTKFEFILLQLFFSLKTIRYKTTNFITYLILRNIVTCWVIFFSYFTGKYLLYLPQHFSTKVYNTKKLGTILNFVLLDAPKNNFLRSTWMFSLLRSPWNFIGNYFIDMPFETLLVFGYFFIFFAVLILFIGSFFYWFVFLLYLRCNLRK